MDRINSPLRKDRLRTFLVSLLTVVFPLAVQLAAAPDHAHADSLTLHGIVRDSAGRGVAGAYYLVVDFAR